LPFSITLETENHEVIETIYEIKWLLEFPDASDQNYCCIKYIDRYGNTVFNRLQMNDLIDEMKALKEKSNNQEVNNLINKIVDLAEKCRGEPHLYLIFYGD
jgi:hypothetical protein